MMYGGLPLPSAYSSLDARLSSRRALSGKSTAGAVEAYSSEDDYVSLDGYVLNRLIIELFEEAGGDQYQGPIDDGGGPGFASAITLLYAQNSQEVFELALSKLNQQLGSERVGR